MKNHALSKKVPFSLKTHVSVESLLVLTKHGDVTNFWYVCHRKIDVTLL